MKVLVATNQDGRDYIDRNEIHWKQEFRVRGNCICSVCNGTIKPRQPYYEKHVIRNMRICGKCVEVVSVHEAVRVYFANSL